MSSFSFAQNSVGKDTGTRKNATQVGGSTLTSSVVVHSSPKISKQKGDYAQYAIVSLQNSGNKYQLHQFNKNSSHLTIGLDGFALLSGS